MLTLFLKLPKVIIAAIYDNISESAKKANMTVKEFIGKDENIEHISLVVYDLLPLVCKLGLRYQKFSFKFHQYFKHFRNMIYTYEDTEKEKILKEEKVIKTEQVKNDTIKKRKPRSVNTKNTETDKNKVKKPRIRKDV